MRSKCSHGGGAWGEKARVWVEIGVRLRMRVSMRLTARLRLTQTHIHTRSHTKSLTCIHTQPYLVLHIWVGIALQQHREDFRIVVFRRVNKGCMTVLYSNNRGQDKG